MASEEPANAPRRGGGRGRGRGRGRGESMSNESRSPAQGGRRGGRGGFARPPQSQRQAESNGAAAAATAAAPTPQVAAESKGKEVAEGEEEVELCWICASHIDHYAVPPCNHRTCHICSLRLRALYNSKHCPHCRTEAADVIFTDDATKLYEDFKDSDIASTGNFGIRYETPDMMEDTRLLLQYNCPDNDCDVACLSWPDLHKHVRTQHHKKICDLCSRHKKVFTHEHELLTDAELQKHNRKGDDNPGAIDQSGFKGHPMCDICKTRYYSDDELFVHCRDSHEKCFICERTSGIPQYYKDYNELQLHFRKDHFMCPHKDCLEQKFIVFPTELDLKAHQLSEHGNELSKDVRRDARTVDMSTLAYRDAYVEPRRGGGSQREQRDGRGRGRGRDPNTEAIPASTAQPLRRDEQAFQRQMAIQTAQSITPRTFGGQLTSAPTPAAARAAPGTRSPPSTSVQPSANVDAVSHVQIPPQTPQEQARALRHTTVIERASTLLQNDDLKMTQFRNSIASYKRGAIKAQALIDTFFTLFSSTSPKSLGTLINEVADLYEDESKTTALRTAWNNWKAINDDYPSLPVTSSTSSSIPLNWASSSRPSNASKSNRVLKLKSSTAQSSRSSVSQTRSWGTASGLASSSNPFPGLPAPIAPKGKVSTTSWVPQASTSASSSAPTSRSASTAPPSRAGRGANDAFPSLPRAPKPQTSLFGYGSGMVRRDGGAGSGGNAWSPSPTPAESEVEGEAGEGAGRAAGKKKGNKGKKQVLNLWA
ncbi:E3 ubiquitin-protein ligase hel2 [Lachnellula cervina]|uniref:RING-type E3 ubiquitin transferase n=1 Tax=Lachnellula cervina TaxID=1316786 RepID=A0A7D8YJP9_9HELO|nr:E3 ubiquitin-protein ligase hel2 [Lachnellula cervina]